MSELWFIADTHFGHDNIVNYCGRPFDHEARMWCGLLDRVRPLDTLVHLGDVALIHRREAHALVERLPGREKILVEGNHDKRSRVRTCEAWAEVHRYKEVWTFERDGFLVAVTHRPSELVEVDADIKIHGHIHEKGQQFKVSPVSGRVRAALWVNACVEHWKYGPIPWSLIRERALAEALPRTERV